MGLVFVSCLIVSSPLPWYCIFILFFWFTAWNYSNFSSLSPFLHPSVLLCLPFTHKYVHPSLIHLGHSFHHSALYSVIYEYFTMPSSSSYFSLVYQQLSRPFNFLIILFHNVCLLLSFYTLLPHFSAFAKPFPTAFECLHVLSPPFLCIPPFHLSSRLPLSVLMHFPAFLPSFVCASGCIFGRLWVVLLPDCVCLPVRALMNVCIEMCISRMCMPWCFLFSYTLHCRLHGLWKEIFTSVLPVCWVAG